MAEQLLDWDDVKQPIRDRYEFLIGIPSAVRSAEQLEELNRMRTWLRQWGADPGWEPAE